MLPNRATDHLFQMKLPSGQQLNSPRVPSPLLLIQSQQWVQQNNVSIMFKVNNKNYTHQTNEFITKAQICILPTGVMKSTA